MSAAPPKTPPPSDRRRYVRPDEPAGTCDACGWYEVPLSGGRPLVCPACAGDAALRMPRGDVTYHRGRIRRVAR